MITNSWKKNSGSCYSYIFDNVKQTYVFSLYTLKFYVNLLFQAERKDKLEKLHTEQLKAEEKKQKAIKKSSRKSSPEKMICDTDKNDKDSEKNDDETDTGKVTKRKMSDSENESKVNEHESDSGISSTESSAEKEPTEGKNDTETEDSDNSNTAKDKESENKIDSDGPNEKGDAHENEPDIVKKEQDDVEDGDKSSKNDVFINETAKCDHSHVSFLGEKEQPSSKNSVSGFKVIKIEDSDNGLFEVNVSAACLKV
jgi:hypothetical protein